MEYPNRFHKIIISVFICFYFYAVGLWLMAPSLIRDGMVQPIEPFILYTGLWQSYNIFSPDPRAVNLDLEALITFPDNSTLVWQYPRMERLGLFERAQKERFRKYGYDHLNQDSESILWPDFARYVARRFDKPNHRPVLVKLVRHWCLIPSPKDGIHNLLPPHSNRYTFLTYPVSPSDLRLSD